MSDLCRYTGQGLYLQHVTFDDSNRNAVVYTIGLWPSELTPGFKVDTTSPLHLRLPTHLEYRLKPPSATISEPTTRRCCSTTRLLSSLSMHATTKAPSPSFARFCRGQRLPKGSTESSSNLTRTDAAPSMRTSSPSLCTTSSLAVATATAAWPPVLEGEHGTLQVWLWLHLLGTLSSYIGTMTSYQVAWAVLASGDSSTLASGVFPARWAGQEHDTASAGCVSSLHPQIVPELRAEAAKLLQNATVTESICTLPARVVGLQAAQDDEHGEQITCRLSAPANRAPSSRSSSWFELKLQRAEHHRQGGNVHFQSGAIHAAIRAYTKALTWLACPSDCAYSSEELIQVNTIAVPCHANLATSHWKREDMDACIHHATKAVALESSHAKARYRRSQAYLHTKQFDEAVADLQALVQSDGERKLFATSLDKAQHRRQQHRAKQQQAFTTAFQS